MPSLRPRLIPTFFMADTTAMASAMDTDTDTPMATMATTERGVLRPSLRPRLIPTFFMVDTTDMETLAKSISLPSPKIRGTMKSRTHGSEKAHYEITVEHQEPRKDSGDQSPPILTPCDIEEKTCALSELDNARISSSNVPKITSRDDTDSGKAAAFEVKKVDTTVTVTD